MARQPQDREDLMAEATALVERIEFELPGHAEPVVAGFRISDCASFFFGPDPVYQFNSQRQLRRAYVDGLLYKAERGRLVSLTRTPTAGRLELLRRELDDAAQERFVSAMTLHLAALRSGLDSGNFKILNQVPADNDVIAHLREWFAALAPPIEVAASAHAR
jgi:hypothetical protein